MSSANRTCADCPRAATDTWSRGNEVRYTYDIEGEREETLNLCDTHLDGFIGSQKETLALYESSLPAKIGVPDGETLTAGIRTCLTGHSGGSPKAIRAYVGLYQTEHQNQVMAMINTISILRQLEKMPRSLNRVGMWTSSSP